MSQKVASVALVEALDGSGVYTEQRNLELWQQVPPELPPDRVLASHAARSFGVSVAAGTAAGVARL